MRMLGGAGLSPGSATWVRQTGCPISRSRAVVCHRPIRLRRCEEGAVALNVKRHSGGGGRSDGGRDALRITLNGDESAGNDEVLSIYIRPGEASVCPVIGNTGLVDYLGVQYEPCWPSGRMAAYGGE